MPTFIGDSGDNTLTGSPDDDVINGLAGNDTLFGGVGDDILDGGPGDDLLDGQNNNEDSGAENGDTASYADAPSGVTVSLGISGPQNTIGAGVDTLVSIESLTGSAFDDVLTSAGSFGLHFLIGGDGNDILDGSHASASDLSGGNGNDILTGGSQQDYLEGGDGDDILDGGSGSSFASDVASYAHASSAVTVDLRISGPQNTGGAGTDTLTNIESLWGSDFDDVLIGASSIFMGFAGNDLFIADHLGIIAIGGTGIDTLSFEICSTGVSTDLITHTTSVENLTGTAFDDNLTGNSGDNVLTGGGGNDSLNGGNGNDTASYASAASRVTVNLTLAAAQNTGGAGTDTLTSIENLTGSAFADILTGDAGANVLIGGGGDDVLVGGDGSDILQGGAGNDILSGGAGNDTARFSGAEASYRVTVTNAGSILISGPDGIDVLSGVETLVFADGSVQVAPVGARAEIQVNTYTLDSQRAPAVASLQDGGWLVVWISKGEDTPLTDGIFGQRYDGSGAPDGAEFRINTQSALNQQNPAITVLADGGWVITWQSENQDGSNFGIYMQRYTTAGAAIGGETRVNTFTTNSQADPAIATLADGGFIVAWASVGQDGSGSGIYAQRYTSLGFSSGAEFRVNATTFSDQTAPSVTALADGGWLVTWTSLGQDGDGWGVYDQRYSSTGQLIGGENRVNTFTASDQWGPSATTLGDGGWLIAWESFTQDGGTRGVYFQRFNADGSSRGVETRANTFTANDQLGASVIALADGGWLVTWSSYGQDQASDTSGGVYGQRYDASGAKTGGEFLVNTTTHDDQSGGATAALGDHGWVIAWTSQGQDGSSNGVFSQRFDAEGVALVRAVTLHVTGDATSQTLVGGIGNDTLDGGSNVDTAIFSGARNAYTITHTGGTATIVGPDGTDTLTNVEFFQFADQTVHFSPGVAQTIDFGAAPSTFMSAIRDFDGNDLGSVSGWTRIGQVDLQGDGDLEQVFVNHLNGRWASVGPAADGMVYFDDHGWGGDTRVVGNYIDPLVQNGTVVQGGPFDSQRRFQNDLLIDNIHGILGAGDYDHDGLQEVYFSITDGTAYLHAYMHADGNIRYANYQSQQQVIDYLTSQGWAPSTWAGWFPRGHDAPSVTPDSEAIIAAETVKTGHEVAPALPAVDPVAELTPASSPDLGALAAAAGADSKLYWSTAGGDWPFAEAAHQDSTPHFDLVAF